MDKIFVVYRELQVSYNPNPIILPCAGFPTKEDAEKFIKKLDVEKHSLIRKKDGKIEKYYEEYKEVFDDTQHYDRHFIYNEKNGDTYDVRYYILDIPFGECVFDMFKMNNE